MGQRKPLKFLPGSLLRNKFAGYFLLAATGPLILFSVISYYHAVESLEKETTNSLVIIAHEKANKIETYFKEKKKDAVLLAQSPILQANFKKIAGAFTQGGKKSRNYLRAEARLRPLLLKSMERFAYYNILLLSPEGDVIFSLLHKKDFGTNLKTGPYRDSALAQVFQGAATYFSAQISDYEYYKPVGESAAFIAVPARVGGKYVGVLVVQLSAHEVNRLVQDYTGLGKTGEILLASKKRGEILYRTPGRHEPDLLKLQKRVRNRAPPKPVTQSLEGKKGAGLYRDYRNVEVLAVWRYLPHLSWGMIVKIDREEAFAPVAGLTRWYLFLGLLVIPAVLGLAFLLARTVTNPILRLTTVTEKITGGETSQEAKVETDDEIGVLARSINYMLGERLKAEDALRKQQEHLEELVEERTAQLTRVSQAVYHSPVSVLLTDLSRCIEYVNPKFEELTGYSYDEIKGKEVGQVLAWAAAPERSIYLDRAIETGKVWRGEFKTSRKNNEIFWERASVSPVRSESGEIISLLIIAEDISAGKVSETELKKSKRKAEAATRAKSQFVANMSHEIRTPMNAVIGLTRLLMDTNLNDMQLGYLANVDVAAKSLLTIINDLLDFSKIEAGKLNLENVEFDLDGLLNNLIALTAFRAQEKELEFLIDRPMEIPPLLLGDPTRLQQILLNLVGNAIKFTETGMVILRIQIENETPEAIELLFQVQDTGPGLSDSQQSALFNAFSQGDNSTSRRYGGTGLGLVICKHLVEMMGGRIKVQSSPGHGSVFSFNLLFKGSGVAREKELSLSSSTGKRVLVVDDNEQSRGILERMLLSYGLQVDVVSDGAAALEKLGRDREENPYQLVVLDWQMPEMDGIETAQKINLLFKGSRPPVLLMVTAFSSEQLRLRAKAASIDGFVPKPITDNLLRENLHKLFDKGVLRNTLEENVLERWWRDGRFAGKRILLAEDNEINQVVAQGLLSRVGIDVMIANDGQEALDLLKTDSFDLILMDVQMPRLTGYQASRVIREDPRYKDLPIIALTAHALNEERRKSTEMGMNDHIIKPIDESELFRVLAKWLGVSMDSKPEPNSGIVPGQEATQPEELPGLDLAGSLERFIGNKKLYLKSLKTFLDELGDADQRLEAHWNKNETREISDLLHTLMGTAGNLGAINVVQATEAFSQNKNPSPAQFKKDTTTLKAALDELEGNVRLLPSLIQSSP